MRLLTTILITLFFVPLSNAQDAKKIASTYVTIQGQHPDEFVYEEDDFLIKFAGGYQSHMNFDILNKSDNYATFRWADTHFVINGVSEAADNLNRDRAAMQTNDAEDQRISPGTRYIAKIGSNKVLFDYFAAKKQNPSRNKVVLTIEINGKLKQIPIDFEVYHRKPKK